MCKMKWRLGLSIPFVALLLLIACSGQDEPVYTTLTEATLTAGEAIPIPTEPVILTVTGLIGTSNDGQRVVMDIPTIEAAGLVSYTLVDPFTEQEVTYTGVLMSDLLDLWQVSEQATVLQMTALNDYVVDVPIQLLREYPIIFAMQANGQYMLVAEKGPAMLVLPYDDFEFARPSSDSFWIWQIKSIDVR